MGSPRALFRRASRHLPHSSRPTRVRLQGHHFARGRHCFTRILRRLSYFCFRGDAAAGVATPIHVPGPVLSSAKQHLKHWHERLGHQHFSDVRQMSKDGFMFCRAHFGHRSQERRSRHHALRRPCQPSKWHPRALHPDAQCSRSHHDPACLPSLARSCLCPTLATHREPRSRLENFSKAEKFAQIRAPGHNFDMKTRHTFGCPVFALRAPLQSG
jgi:hypothetical protein